MINCWTRTEMFVADDRVDEYLAAGCMLAADSVTKAEPAEKPKKATKTTAKKTTATKKK